MKQKIDHCSTAVVAKLLISYEQDHNSKMMQVYIYGDQLPKLVGEEVTQEALLVAPKMDQVRIATYQQKKIMKDITI